MQARAIMSDMKAGNSSGEYSKQGMYSWRTKHIDMKKLFLLILLLPIIAGCEKFLNPEQIDLTYNEVFWSSQSDAEKAVMGLYSTYRGVMLNSQWYERGDVTTGFFHTGWNGGSSNKLYLPGDFDNKTGTDKSWGSLESFADWSGYYKVVAQANLAIKHIELMSDNLFDSGKKEKLLGEAHFIRGLVYFNIARIWGNAPLVTEAIESSDQVLNDDRTLVEKARSTDTEIMDFVLGEVNQAVSMLDYGVPGTSEWGIRANKGSAQALAGHVNLWMDFIQKRDGASPGDEYVDAAITALEALVTYGNYSLVNYDNPSAVADMYIGQSSEAVFELNISLDDGESYRIDYGGIVNLTSKVVPLDGDETKDRANKINFVPASKKQLIFPEYPTDKRADLFFEAWESTYETAFSDVSIESPCRDSVTYLLKYSAMTIDPARQWNEYQAYFSEANIPVFRYSGIKLLLAEAYAKKGTADGQAIAIVNEIRNRAGLLPYSGTDLIAEILQQRTSELIGEGHIFFDYVRNNYYSNVQVMTSTRVLQEGYYWPVSSNVLTSNKLIHQTPYWNGKTVW